MLETIPCSVQYRRCVLDLGPRLDSIMLRQELLGHRLVPDSLRLHQGSILDLGLHLHPIKLRIDPIRLRQDLLLGHGLVPGSLKLHQGSILVLARPR